MRLNRHLFYLAVDLGKYFPQQYTEETIITMPLEFTGRIEIFPRTLQAAAKGSFFISVPKYFSHARALSKEIGLIQIEKEFLEAIWSCKMMKSQIHQLHAMELLHYEEEYQLIEDF